MGNMITRQRNAEQPADLLLDGIWPTMLALAM
jgi:hypothetical protein